MNNPDCPLPLSLDKLNQLPATAAALAQKFADGKQKSQLRELLLELLKLYLSAKRYQQLLQLVSQESAVLLKDQLGMDSLARAEFIVMLEELFLREFELEKLAAIRSLEDFLNELHAQIIQPPA